MKGLYLLSLIAVITVTANAVETTLKPCVIVPGCPTKNDADNTVHVPYEDNCHKFYKCNARCGYLMECPLIPGTTERLVFNPTAQVCDWPGSVPDVKCSASEPCVAPTQVQDCTFFKPCTADLFENMAHDTDCHNFYLCTNGRKISVTCPNDEIFNAEKKQCEKAKCGSQCYITGNCQ